MTVALQGRHTDTSKLAFKIPVFAIVALVLTLATTPLAAQKLYKVVDDKGNVSYQDTPPMDESLQVEEKHVDINNSKLRRDPLPNARANRPNSGSSRQIAAPAAPVSTSSSTTPEVDEAFAEVERLNQGFGGLPGAGNAGSSPQGGGQFVPRSSDQLRNHFDNAESSRSPQPAHQPFNQAPTNSGEPQSLTVEDLAEIARQLGR